MDKEQFWNELKSGTFSSMIKESSKGKRLLSPENVYHVMKPLFAEKADFTIDRFEQLLKIVQDHNI